ncbi:MAG: hypothetical protein J4G17_00365 [Anaerolineae bacterium]|nr:hypothetical protein [Anaerolineae bacterium]
MMVAMPQLQELQALPEIPPLPISGYQDDAAYDELECNLFEIDKIIDSIDQLLAWLVDLDLGCEKEPVLSEGLVASHLAVIEDAFEFRSDFNLLVQLWNERVDKTGNWRGPGTLSKPHAKRTKQISLRYRRMGNRVRKVISHEKKRPHCPSAGSGCQTARIEQNRENPPVAHNSVQGSD